MLSPLKLTPNMPTEVMIDAINQNFRQLESESRRKVITDENGVDRILIGREETGDYVIKVSGAGKDVNRAYPDELVMSSEWDLWKIIDSGRITANGADITRAGVVSISSSNIAYVHDIYIKIDDDYGNTEDLVTSGYSGNLQAFVRDAATRKDLNNTRLMYNTGTNTIMRHDCYFVTPGGWLTIRRMFVYVQGGAQTLTPSNYLAIDAYWSIANPTRIFVGGMGGGGTRTGQNVYHDRIIYNGSSKDYPDYLTDGTGNTPIAPGEFGTVESETIVLWSTSDGYLFNENTIFNIARTLPSS